MKAKTRLILTGALVILLLVACGLVGTAVSAFSDSGTAILSPNTGEKPSATPYILGGVMLLCVVVIVFLFLPKKKGKQETPPMDDERE